MSEFVEQRAHFVQLRAFSLLWLDLMLDIIQEAAITCDNFLIFHFHVSYAPFFTAASTMITHKNTFKGPIHVHFRSF